jgi:hypothetical protein
VNSYCLFHAQARGNIVAKYEQWKKAVGISWKEYLSEIAKNPLVGEWAKEVAHHMMASGEQIDVKKRKEECL